MKSKKLPLILICVAFIAFTIFAVIMFFTTKQVKVNFSVSEKITYTQEVQDKLNRYEGANLLFFDENKIIEEFTDYPYLEITSVKKDFPNVIEVDIKERREVYSFTDGTNFYTADENGIVPSKANEQKVGREYLLVEFDGINITSAEVGKKLVADFNDCVYNAFDIAKSVNLTDCIKSMTVLKNIEQTDVSFLTYSGVKITLRKADKNGVEKAKKAFSVYDSEVKDYVKSFNGIEVIEKDDGEIICTWTRHGA